jgi:hypothetical protein
LVETEEDTKLIKIACFDNNLIGLTNQGHVLRFSSLENELESSRARGAWSYVSPICCSRTRRCSGATFAAADVQPNRQSPTASSLLPSRRQGEGSF